MPVMALFTALPMWIKVGAGMGLLMGIMQLTHWWNTRDLKRDLAKQEETLKRTQEEAAKAAADTIIQLQREEANRLELESQIARQNARINDVATRARQAETAAALATIRQVKDGQAAADALRDKSTTVPVGYESMNQWTRQRFSNEVKK